jgi:hypothetical protein
MKSLAKISLVLLTALVFVIKDDAQTPKQLKKEEKAAALKKKIEAKTYTFVPEFALPMRGGQRYLDPIYTLKIVPDSVIASLPYFGQVYMQAPINPDEAGINFASTKFDYMVTERKKGGWSIVINLHDVTRNSTLRLDVFTNGTATLQALSNTRDQISFNGYIKQ